ncbi:TetR/AcrR family transcriptional regulator [Amycolatopsis anabasis]|uniref:TetR/AcrR family transcriptional regulator n=1 Tax=Amycolatopsis anabasis TaxID=1840409 RepID=UPI00131EAB59|nr:TetR/AcrR family transcriptional regulator [Amycolatopsis anabasis]
MRSRNGSRRTQADRRAAARLALLDATIDCLAEFGYTRVTGAQIAERAGVTRGLQAYYFSTKAELVAAALEHLTGKMVDWFRAELPDGPDPVANATALLDRFWELHGSQGFAVSAELLMASRTDPELREHVAAATRRMTGAILDVVREVLPEPADHEDFLAVVTTATAALRGVAVMGFTMSEQAQHALWLTVRGQLEKLLVHALKRA